MRVAEMPGNVFHAASDAPEGWAREGTADGQNERRAPLVPPSPWKWAVALALASTILMIAKPYIAVKSRNEEFSLTTTDRNGRMEVHWDPTISAVKTAQSGVLDVLDGTETRRYPVDSKVLRSGALDYLRNAEDATVSLILVRDGQQIAQATVRSVGAIGTAPEPPRVSTSYAKRRR